MKHALSPRNNPAELHLRLLGGFSVQVDGTAIPEEQWKSRRARSLVKLLALAPGHRLHRDQVMDVLWPEAGLSAAANSLHQTLHAARRMLDPLAPGCLRLDEGFLSLSGGEGRSLSVDVEQFEAAAAQAKKGQDPQAHQSALALYPGELLPEDRYEEWAVHRREALHQVYLQLLFGLAQLQETQRDYPAGFDTLQCLVAADPSREEAHAAIMRLYALNGQRQQALRQYELLCKVLQTELDAEPSTDTRQLYEAIQSGEFAEAAPQQLPSLPIPRHNLPAQLTSFIGREQEIAEVTRLLRDHRLVTLTGPGGTGKTRLALQTAAGLLDDFADGVWLVELAPLFDTDLIPQFVARALGMREAAGELALSLLQDYLAPRKILLIFDNCEHMIEACARLAAALLHSCPRLSVLATSREVLGVAGEAPFRVPHLSLPDPHHPPAPEHLAQYEAIRLFIERAQTTSPGFQINPQNASAVDHVCQRLDGIPLAIELAAARVQLLRVEEIAQRLDDRFGLLTGGSRAALPRHQTLRACIDWSYELLSPLERILLQRLSVFVGGWVLGAAEAVCSFPPTNLSPSSPTTETVGNREANQTFNVLELLGQLVGKSLVQTIQSIDGLNRFRMLETIHQYAHEKLVEAGQAQQVRKSHLQYYLELAETVEWKLRGPDQAQILEQVEAELDNLRLALEWSMQRQGRAGWDPEPGLRLASALLWFWHCRGRHAEGIQWLERLLSLEAVERGDGPADPSRGMKRAKALQAAGNLAITLGENTKAAKWVEESRDLFLGLGPDGKRGYAYALYYLGSLAWSQSDLSKAEGFTHKSLVIFHETNDRFGMAGCMQTLRRIAWRHQNFRLTKKYAEDELALRKEIGDSDGAAGALMDLGNLAIFNGEDEQARNFISQSRVIFVELKNEYALAYILAMLGHLDWIEGKYKLAARNLDDVLRLSRQQGDVNSMYLSLSGLGSLALSRGDPQQASKRFEENLTFNRKLDNRYFLAGSLCDMGNLAFTQGELEQAARCYAEALEISQELGNQLEMDIALYDLARLAYAHRDYQAARTHLVESLASGLLHSTGGYLWWGNTFPLETLAFLAISQKQMDRGARLLGATEIKHQRYHNIRTPRERQEREAHVTALRAALGEEAFNAAWEEGKAMTLDQARAYALEES